MMLASIVISTQAARLREQADLARQRERKTQIFYRLTRMLTATRERQAVCDMVVKHAEDAIRERTSVPPDLEDATTDGAAARQRVGADAYRLHVQQFACAGLNYGYFYDRSPIIAYDSESAPPYSMYDYTPSTVPGCRLPHFWLRDGRSLYDVLGPHYALLRFNPAVDVSGLLDAAAHAGMPLLLIDIEQDELPGAYHHHLVLSRPDLHVAWRADAPPENAGALINVLRGVES